MQNRFKHRLSLQSIAGALLAMAGLAMGPTRALAIPPFARKYQTSCLTCHVAPPKLNAFGRAFKNRGFRMPKDDEDLISVKQVPLGAPAWKEVWPKGTWPDDIPGGNYFGIRFLSSYNVNPNAKVNNEFDGLGNLALFMGGTIGETVSFFGDFDLFEGGQPGGIGAAFVQYNHPSHLLNITVGEIAPRAQPFVGDFSVTGQTDYLTNVFPMISTGNYFAFSPNHKGIEYWGGLEGPKGKGGLLWAAGIANSELGDPADSLSSVPELSDQIANLKAQIAATGGDFAINSGKDVYFQGSYKIGGLGIFGSGAASTLKQTRNWRDDSLTLGGYWYQGRTAAFLNQSSPNPVFDASGNRFYRAGATFDWWFRDLNLFGGWQRNRDELRDGTFAKASITTAEANYVLPWPWLQPALRYEAVNPDFGQSFSRTTLSATVLIRANALLTLQGSKSSKHAPDWPYFEQQFRAILQLIF